jgi:outer membrane receptor protein involved in Fe transport
MKRRSAQALLLAALAAMAAQAAAAPAAEPSADAEAQADPPTEARNAKEDEDPILVTGTRTGDGRAAGITIVERAGLRRLQSPTLLDALGEVAGVRAFSTGGTGGGSFVSVRGGEPNFTLVLLDGVRLNNPTNSKGGGFDFTLVDPWLVDRIEVARGAVSAVYGADALSGVIEIGLIEPRPGDTVLAGRLHGASDGGAGAGLALRHGWSEGGLLLAASRSDSDALDEQEASGSSLERNQLLARLTQRLGGWDARLLALHADTERSLFPEDSGGPLFAVIRERERASGRLSTAALSVRRAAGATWRPGLSLAWSRQEEESDAPPIAPGELDGVPALAARSIFTSWEGIADLRASRGPLAAAAGLSLLRESGRSDGTIDFGFPLPVAFALDRDTLGAFAEASFRPAAALTLNLAGRYDRTSGDGRLTGRFALTWRPGRGGPELFARAGTGFKQPSFYALGHPLIGNPALRPERSRNVELGIAWSGGGDAAPAGRLGLRLTLFANRYRDLIDFDPVLFTTVNRPGVTARGAEAEASWSPVSGLAFAAALAHLDLDSPTPLRGRPAWHGSLRAAWRPGAVAATGIDEAIEGRTAAKRGGRLELHAALRFNSDFNDSSIPTGLVRADGHAEIDLGVSWRLTRRLSLHAVLRNAAGSRHQDAVGFPARRVARVSLAAAF